MALCTSTASVPEDSFIVTAIPNVEYSLRVESGLSVVAKSRTGAQYVVPAKRRYRLSRES
jgi:hypothetical protein